MTPLDAAACAERLGEPVGVGGLLMRDAMAVRASALLDAWLAVADPMNAEVARIERVGALWRLVDRDGGSVAEAEIVVLAAGWGVAGLAPGLPLSPVAGQADWVEGVTAPPVAWGGYAAPGADGLLFGATHERGVVDPVASTAAGDRNLATLAQRLPELASRLATAGPSAGRVAVRATTPDRLPLAGRLADGLFVLGGLGSRGFCVAPLLAEHIAALALGAPSPLPRDLAARVDPGRFPPAPGLAQPAGREDG